MTARRHEKPLRRVNPSGKVVWVARYTGRDGNRYSAGTRPLQREAQALIDAAYDREYRDGQPSNPDLVGDYFDSWLRRHPRSPRTERSYSHRVRAVLDVRLERRPFRAWRVTDVRRREVTDLVDVLLAEQGRSAAGARGVLTVLSAMWEDAIADDRAAVNPFRGVRVRSSDPRVRKAPRKISVWSWEDMRAVAAAAPGVYGPGMLLTLALCGLRLGEMLALERQDVSPGWLAVRRTAYDGKVDSGTKTTRGEADGGRVVPVSAGLEAVLRGLPARLDTRLLFPAPRGGVLHNCEFYRQVWYPARSAVRGLGAAVPHEFRHSYVTLMRAAGVDPADLAAWTGHTVLTATTHYTHSTGGSEGLLREVLAG